VRWQKEKDRIARCDSVIAGSRGTYKISVIGEWRSLATQALSGFQLFSFSAFQLLSSRGPRPSAGTA
jgi:hypothetical protein